MTVDGHPAGISDKGEDNEPWEGQSFGVAKLGQADCHMLMSLIRSALVSSHEPVPPWEIEAEVRTGAVALGLLDGDQLVAERQLKEVDGRSTIFLPAASVEANLLVRNGANDGVSRVAIYRVELIQTVQSIDEELVPRQAATEMEGPEKTQERKSAGRKLAHRGISLLQSFPGRRRRLL